MRIYRPASIWIMEEILKNYECCGRSEYLCVYERVDRISCNNCDKELQQCLDSISLSDLDRVFERKRL